MSRKNENKTLARQHYGTGQHDGERFPFEPGPASNGKSLNFYGHFNPSHASKRKRFGIRADAVMHEKGIEGLQEWIKTIKIPGWLRRRNGL